ncbi:MAG: hypothetical protein ACRCXT_01095 [Paraclostridium sp.]
MCLHLYNNKNLFSTDMFSEEYKLLKEIYTSIADDNIEDARSLTENLIQQQTEKGNTNNINFLQDALNNLK